MKINQIIPAKGFKYLDVPQLSPEWVQARVGRKTASRLKDWMAVGKNGNPLKARTDYERELAYEQTFGVPFSRFVTEAMVQGSVAEPFIKEQYGSIMGYVVQPAGAFYNEDFVASPDGFVDDDGSVECKWLFDNSFSDVLLNGVPMDHQWQIQGQLWASGREWCDYVAANGNTKKLKIIRVYPDKELISRIAESVKEPIKSEFSKMGVFDFTKEPDTINW